MAEQPQARPVLGAAEVQKLAMETAAKGAERAVGSALTAPQKAVAEIAAKNLGANKAREAALTVTTGLTHTADADGIEQRLFLSKVDAGGSRKGNTPAETARLATIKGLREAYTQLILEPANVTAAQLVLLRPQIEAMIMSNAAQFPGLQEAFSAGGGGFDAALVTNLMKNPQVAQKLAAEINRVYDQGAAELPEIARIEEQMLQEQQSVVSLTAEKTALKQKKTGITSGKTDETAFYSGGVFNYNNPDGTSTSAPSKGEALSQISQELQSSGATDPGVISYARNLAELRGFEEQLTIPGQTATEKSVITKEIRDRKLWIAKAENDPQFGRLCKTYKTLAEEQHDIEVRIALSKNPTAMSELDANIRAKGDELVKAVKKVEDLMLEKNTKVGEIESALKIALAEASAQQITEEKNAVFTNYPEYERQAMTALEERARHAVHEALKSRYFKMEAVPSSIWQRIRKADGRSYKDVFQPIFDHATARQDIMDICKPGFDAASWIKTVGTGATPPLTSDEMDLLVKDPQFVKDHMTIATQRALRAYEWNNGMGKDTMAALVATDWGAAAMDYVIKQNESTRDLRADYEAAGGSISRKLSEKLGPGYLVQLLMMMGGLGGMLFVRKKD